MPEIPVIRTPAQQQQLPFGASTMKIVATAADTGGALGMVEYVAPPATQPPPPLMTHTREDCTIWVLAGTLYVRLADREVMVPAGGTVTVKRGTPYSWWTRTHAPLRLLLVFSPGGVEQFFAEVLEIAREMGPDADPEEFRSRLAEVQHRYGVSPA